MKNHINFKNFITAYLLAGNFIIISKAQAQQSPALVANPNKNGRASMIEVQSFTINSVIMGEKREILIVLPSSYEKSSSERRYPITVVTDGEYLIPTLAIVNNELTGNGQIPESILLGITNVSDGSSASSNKRVYDLTPPGLSVSGSSLNEGGDRFLDFIEKEVLPAADKQFRTGEPRFFVGHSSGGLLGTYAAATRSVFCAVVSLDAPVQLGDSWAEEKLISRASTGGKPVRYASLESSFGWSEKEWKKLTLKAPSTWTLYREKLKLEGHETMFMVGAYIGLRQVFNDYSRFSIPETASRVLTYYDELGKSMGGTVIPPKVVLENLVLNLIGEGRKEMAEAAYEKLVFGYGPPPDSSKIIAQIKKIENRPVSETVEGLLATPFPTPEEARLFIGEWVGDIWMGPDQPRSGKTLLRIRVENGKVLGETIHVDGSGTEHVQPWGYMKITPEGLWWGRLNDKQPKGVMLFKSKLDGDSLSGTGQFAGILLNDPPPPLNFSFRRVKPDIKAK